MAKTRIVELCKMKGMTQQELADRLGIYRTSLSTAINNDTLSIERLSVIAEILEVEFLELFKDYDDLTKSFTALISYKGELYQFNSIVELKEFVDGID